MRLKIIITIVVLGAVLAGYLFLSPKPVIRHVILISMDTTRSDFLSCYGYPCDTTPNIDVLAQTGVLFENVITPQPYTLPAHCSMLTGTVPPYHGVLDNKGYILGKDNVVLAEILKKNGFSTAGFISAFVLDSQFGLDQGFDVYDDEFENEQITVAIVERTGDETTRHVIKWLEEKRGEKNFVFLHYYDPHMSYEAPEPFRSKFAIPSGKIPMNPKQDQGRRDAYAGEIAFTDHCIGRVIEKLKELEMYDSSLIIITADHGEGLGDHKETTHGYFIYQDTVKVPLVIKVPGSSKGRRIKSPVGLIDIVPTVCSLLGLETPAGIQGENLNPYINGQEQVYPDRHLFTQGLEATVYGGNSLLGVVNDRYKYIQTTRPELYDLVNDPGEHNNLFAKELNRSRIMKDRLAQMLEETVRRDAAFGAKNMMDDDTRNRLESLGYVGRTVSEDLSFDQSKEDPKDLIDYHVLNAQLAPLVTHEKFTLARDLCRKLISLKPGFYKPYFDLAKVAMKEKNYQDVIINLEKTLELKPGYIEAYEGLADVYDSLGKPDKVLEQYKKILELQPDNVKVYFLLSEILYDQGKYDQADKYFTRQLTKNPSYEDMAVTLAEKLLAKQQNKLAYKHFLRILETDSESIETLNSLAWLEGASKIEGIRNPDKALKNALKACELTSYEQAEVVDTLAVAYAALGQYEMAIKMAEKAVRLADKEGDNGLSQRIGTRLRLYKSGRMFVDESLN
ncbi:MAG: sulfatase-like hydrolase/transferase [Sedimentisphaerales bacterium]|nr:sulfatase-like hydrolase/transferase [Sedimentisphaerales bacterium]